MLLSTLGAQISKREHASRVLLCMRVPSFAFHCWYIIPALPSSGPVQPQGPVLLLCRDPSPGAAGWREKCCRCGCLHHSRECHRWWTECQQPGNKHLLSTWGFLWQMMWMKAVLCKQGSDLPNCFSAPASGIRITRENGVLKIPNFCLSRESNENMVNRVFSLL